MKDKNRRRHYFIDKGFQSRFIIKFCLLIIITSLLTGMLIYIFNRHSTTVAFDNLKVVVKSTSDFILPIMLQILIIVTFLIGLATIVTSLLTSHKLVGPLYRFKLGIDQMKTGDLSSPFSVRTGDQLQKTAYEFDMMRVSLKDSIAVLKQNWPYVKEKTLFLINESKQKEAQVNYAIEKIDSELDKFKTD